MRRFGSATAAAAGTVLALLMLTGCNQGADTSNAVTPGPPLPSGMTVTPPAVHFIPPTAPASTSP